MARDDRPAELPAVRTTIVGGRPPGSGKPLGPIPRGIEVLVKKAAVDPAFKRLLLETRDAAADEIGLALDPAEALILRAAPPEQLEAIIARTKVHPKVRSAFLGRAAAVMLVALGAGVVGCDKFQAEDGISPDRPPAKTVEPPEAGEAAEPAPAEAEPEAPFIRMAGIQPEIPAPVEEPLERPERVEPTDGIRPMRPPEASPKVEPAPDPKPPAPAPTGIRPDRPPEASKDESSRAPHATAAEPVTSTTTSHAVSRGVRPDRPTPKPPTGGAATAEEPGAPTVATMTLPAAWDEQEAMRAFARGLKHLATRSLAKHAFTFKDGKKGQIRLAWKTQEYRLTVPAGKAGGTKKVDVTGPAPDGLILTAWLQKEPGQAVRPQTLDRDGKYKADLRRVRLLPLETYLNFNVEYGPKTNKGLLNVFSTPQIWYRMHNAPQPGEATSRGARPDRPPTTKGIRPDRP